MLMDGIMCDRCVVIVAVVYISKKKYNSYFIWLWSQVQKWYTLLGKKLDFAYQKNGKNGKKTYIIIIKKNIQREKIPLWNMEHHQIYYIKNNSS